MEKFSYPIHVPETLPLPMYLNPGPGHWRIQDEEGKIGLEDGWLTFTPPNNPLAWGKQYAVATPPIPRGSLVLALVRRTGGRYCQPLALVNSETPSWGFCGNVEAGFNTGLSPWLATCQAFTTGPPIVRVSYDGTEYCVAIALLPERGVMYFIKGGAYTNWTYLYTIQKGVSPELYVASCNYDSDYALKLVTASALPAMPNLFYDDFDSLNPAWIQNGCLSASGGLGVLTPTLTPLALIGPLTPNATTEARFFNELPTGERFGLICADRPITRLTDEWNGFLCWHDGNLAYLDEVIAGVPQNVRSQEWYYKSGHRFVLRRGVGGVNNVDLFWHGVRVGDTYTATNPDVLAASYVGLFSTTSQIACGNMTVLPTGNNGEYSFLDSYL
jgi:hypothetical protein